MTLTKASNLVASIAPRFAIDADYVDARRYGSGHINDTFCADYRRDGRAVRYIHQRINHKVFPDIPGLMKNIGRVTRHVRAKLQDDGAAEVDRRVLTLVPTIDGDDYAVDADGSYWRTYVFLEGSRTYDVAVSPKQAYEAARAFGEFSRRLADIQGERLHDTIPRFHDTGSRIAAMFDALRADARRRAANARDEIAFVQDREDLADVLPRLQRKGLLRERISHNDTKINNVMLDDATGTGICVIDLDTVMPGLALYDFGDLVRTATMSAAEDEPDLSKVSVQIPMFDAVARGFAAGTSAMLTPTERAQLVTAAKVITYTIGVRFLTDYLAGDVYFKVHREGHNLDRARTQFALVRSLEAHEETLEASVAAAFDGAGEKTA